MRNPPRTRLALRVVLFRRKIEEPNRRVENFTVVVSKQESRFHGLGKGEKSKKDPSSIVLPPVICQQRFN